MALTQLTTWKFFANGRMYTVWLFPAHPHPSDAFVPEEDKVSLLLKFSISSEEASQMNSTKALKKAFRIPAKFNKALCNVEYGVVTIGRRHYFNVIYHVKDEVYAELIYDELKKQFFK